jgi:hypothetical protein
MAIQFCPNCQYSCEPGPLDTDIPGGGNWCSNSESPLWRTRVGEGDTCERFIKRGKKAPFKLRAAVMTMWVINHVMPPALDKVRRKRKRKKKRA